VRHCPFCDEEIAMRARKCRHCGEWLDGRPRHVRYQNVDDPTMAIVTLLLYLFVYPAGVIVNIVGLFTAPKKGCFVWMLLVFVGLPAAVILGFLLLAVLSSLLSQQGAYAG